MRNPESWLATIGQTESNTYTHIVRSIARFAATRESLDIHPSYIQGRVLVAGNAHVMPERALLCTPESDFIDPRPEITSIWCTDYANPLESHFPFAWPIIKLPITKAMETSQTIISYDKPLQQLLSAVPAQTFDSILFFGIQDFGDQLDANAFVRIQRALTPGGFFMGNGGMSWGMQRSHIQENALEANLHIVTIQALSNADSSGTYSDNTGIIVQK